ncbi:MAG TPA: hypothetical protein VHS78_03780 [Candidatus Elarobacter sp.]|jgi:hypothetical protein|nr:hypothetical protein [Candidatus Elarobacter sp.]
MTTNSTARTIIAALGVALSAQGCGGGTSAGTGAAPLVPAAPGGPATASGQRSAAATAATAPSQHDPVILIPGMTSPADEMAPMKQEFVNAGWSADRVFMWTDSTDMEGDLATAARELQTEVATVMKSTNARKVVLVTWSAAALAARYYIKNIDRRTVSIYVGMAGPEHGTTFNDCQAYVSCQEFMSPNTPFLTALNKGTEVPGSPAISYLTVRSDNDLNVAPEDSAQLAGATLNARLTGPTAPNHFEYPVDPQTFAVVQSFITEYERTGGATRGR